MTTIYDLVRQNNKKLPITVRNDIHVSTPIVITHCNPANYFLWCSNKTFEPNHEVTYYYPHLQEKYPTMNNNLWMSDEMRNCTEWELV